MTAVMTSSASTLLDNHRNRVRAPTARLKLDQARPPLQSFLYERRMGLPCMTAVVMSASTLLPCAKWLHSLVGPAESAPRAPLGMRVACVAPTTADGAHMAYMAM